MNVSEIERREHYLNISYGIRSWLLTTDHKRIAWLYLLSVTLFFFIGGFFSPLIPLEVLTPPRELVQAEDFNKVFWMHCIPHVWVFLIPSVSARVWEFFFSG